MTALRDDELTQALLPTVADLVVAVHDHDEAEVAAAFATAERLAGGPLVGAQALAILAAGMAREEDTMTDALGWTLDHLRYATLRDGGMPSLEASRLCARSGVP